MMRALEGYLTGAALALAVVALPVAATACGDALSAEPTLEATASAQAPANLDGTWALNRELSDLPDRPGPMRGDGPADRWSEGSEGRPDGARGDGPPGMRPGGPGMHGEGRGQLVIAVSDASVAFTRGSGRTVTVTPDGQTVTETVGRGEWAHEIQITAVWTDDGLSIERAGERGTATEIFAVRAGGQQLYVDATLTPSDGSDVLTFRRVYDRVPE